MRSLVAEGRLVNKDGVFVPNGDLTALAVPSTLTALIASRLDALDETDRRILHDAAVLGQSFSLAAVVAIADLSEAEVEPRLLGLVRREVLQREMDPRSPEQGQYAFVQALIREVAYNTLSKHDRKKLHLAAARYFESMGSDELAGVLASHYLAAHGAAAEGAEADALAAQARIALKSAATRARSLGSYDQARTFVEQALSVSPDPAEQVELLTEAADDSRIAGHVNETEAALRRGIELASQLKDRDKEALLISRLSRVLGASFKIDEAATTLAQLPEFSEVNERAAAEGQLAVARAAQLQD